MHLDPIVVSEKLETTHHWKIKNLIEHSQAGEILKV